MVTALLLAAIHLQIEYALLHRKYSLQDRLPALLLVRTHPGMQTDVLILENYDRFAQSPKLIFEKLLLESFVHWAAILKSDFRRFGCQLSAETRLISVLLKHLPVA